MKCKPDWETVRAENFCAFVTDGTHDSPKAQKQGHKLITSKHLKEYHIDFESANWISESDYQKVISRSGVEQWDILYSMIGTVGNCYLERNAKIDYACKNMGIFKFSGNADNAYWMYYYLKSPIAKEHIRSHMRGSTQAYIPLGELRNLPVLLPPKKIRDKIISILRAIDDKIALNMRINNNLQQQLQAVFQSEIADNAFTGTMEQIPLNDLCSIITKGTTPTTLGKLFVAQGINFIKAESILDNHSFDTSKFAFIDMETNQILRRSIIQSGDILFTIAGSLGRFALTDDDILPANTNQAIAIIRADRNKVMPEYLYTFFLGNWHYDYYTKRIQQAVQANLSLSTIKSLPIPILPADSMKEYIQIVTPMISFIKKNEKENIRLQKIRNSLLPRLMSGELDVSKIDL